MRQCYFNIMCLQGCNLSSDSYPWILKVFKCLYMAMAAILVDGFECFLFFWQCNNPNYSFLSQGILKILSIEICKMPIFSGRYMVVQ